MLYVEGAGSTCARRQLAALPDVLLLVEVQCLRSTLLFSVRELPFSTERLGPKSSLCEVLEWAKAAFVVFTLKEH